MADERYQVLRSVSDNHIHLICHDAGFENLPDHVRHQGPWQALRRGEIVKLKPEYRRDLARDGSVLVETGVAAFNPEA